VSLAFTYTTTVSCNFGFVKAKEEEHVNIPLSRSFPPT
jgi:hypothetical protein